MLGFISLIELYFSVLKFTLQMQVYGYNCLSSKFCNFFLVMEAFSVGTLCCE
jgi:hypothetical protein